MDPHPFNPSDVAASLLATQTLHGPYHPEPFFAPPPAVARPFRSCTAGKRTPPASRRRFEQHGVKGSSGCEDGLSLGRTLEMTRRRCKEKELKMVDLRHGVEHALSEWGPLLERFDDLDSDCLRLLDQMQSHQRTLAQTAATTDAYAQHLAQARAVASAAEARLGREKAAWERADKELDEVIAQRFQQKEAARQRASERTEFWNLIFGLVLVLAFVLLLAWVLSRPAVRGVALRIWKGLVVR